MTKQFNKSFGGTLGVIAGMITAFFIISFSIGAGYVFVVGMQQLLQAG